MELLFAGEAESFQQAAQRISRVPPSLFSNAQTGLGGSAEQLRDCQGGP